MQEPEQPESPRTLRYPRLSLTWKTASHFGLGSGIGGGFEGCTEGVEGVPEGISAARGQKKNYGPLYDKKIRAPHFCANTSSMIANAVF